METKLDLAVARLTEETEAVWRAFYDGLADSDLYLLLETAADSDQVSPRLVTLDGQSCVLVFDHATRLAAFAGREAEFACLPGKDLCAVLAPEGLGLALNPEVSEYPYLMAPEAVQWLAETLIDTPAETPDRPAALRLPVEVPEGFLRALDLRLTALAGAASRAVLTRAAYPDGSERLLLAFIGGEAGLQARLTQSVRDAAALTLPEEALDIGFFSPGDAIVTALERNGLSFDLPEPPVAAPVAPGMDPDKPPIL